MRTLTGRVTGRTITLDEVVPDLDGKRVRMVVEPADETDVAIDGVRRWREWLEHGPQGLLDDDAEPEFP